MIKTVKMKKNLYRVLGIFSPFLVISCGKDKPVTSEANEVLTKKLMVCSTK